MNLRIAALIPWMVTAGMAHSQIRTADVLYSSKDGSVQHAYRLGDECFVPLDTLSSWGWTVNKKDDSVDVTGEGHTVHLDLRSIAGKYAIALRKAVTQLGGDSAWTSGTDVLNVFSPLSQISVQGLKVHAEGGFNFHTTPSFIAPGSELIDLVGARITDSTKQNLPPNATAIQYRPNTVRITVNAGFVPRPPGSNLPDSNKLDYSIVKDQDLTDKEAQNSAPGAEPILTRPTALAAEVISVEVLKDEEVGATIQVRLPNPLIGSVTVNKTDPLTLEIVLPVAAQLPTSNFYLSSRTISSVVATPSTTSTILTFHLNRAMVPEIITGRNGVSINLKRARLGTGHLAGKLVVVDPGHGGHDRGSHAGDVNEKDLNLPIGKKIAADFQAAGATVIITRTDDTFIPLTERAALSNRNHADIFISCHINSTGGDSVQSGTITFYHKSQTVSKYLAECIQHEIAKVNGLPDLGVWSDSKIYSIGFSVLRNTTAPCVLIEMGFINNAKDRARMMTADFQDSVAAAVVRGARVYFGETKTNE